VAVVALLTATAGLGMPAGASSGTTEDDEGNVLVPEGGPSTDDKPGDDLGAYRNHTEMLDRVHELEDRTPDLVDVTVVGHTVQGRELVQVTVADPDAEDPRTEVLFDAAHHGNEIISAELALRFLEDLATGYGEDAELTELVEDAEVHFVPMVNADGTANIPYCDWYGDCRKNANGVDVNRNYAKGFGGEGASSDPSSATYHGPAAFSEPESSTVAQVLDSEDVTMHWSMHSGTELILWPWGYTREAPPEEAVYEETGDRFSDLTGIDHGQASTALYVASGTTMDWAYDAPDGPNPLSYTPEVYGGSGGAYSWWSFFNPPMDEIDDVYETWRPAMLEAVEIADTYTDVRVGLEPFETPVPAELSVTVANEGERTFTDGTLALEGPAELGLDGAGNRTLGTLATGDSATQTWTVTADGAGTFEVDLAAASPIVGTFEETVEVEVPEVGVDLDAERSTLAPFEDNPLSAAIGAIPHEELEGNWSLTVTGDTATGPYEDTLATGEVQAQGERLAFTTNEAFDAEGVPDGDYRATLELDYEGTLDGEPVSGTVADDAAWTVERPQLVADKPLAPTERPGQPLPVNLDVTNAGSLAAEEATVTERIPPGYLLAPTAGGGLNPYQHLATPAPDAVLAGTDGTTQLEWDVGELAPGDTFTASYELVPLAPGTYEHATVGTYEHAYEQKVVDFEDRSATEHRVGPG